MREWRWFGSRWVHGAVVMTAVFWCFQYFPVDTESHQPAGRLIVYMLKNGLQSLLDRSPSWMGLWNVYVPRGKFHQLAPTGEEVEEEAKVIHSYVEELKKTTFFRIFKVDLGKECPFWARENLCTSPGGSCSVCECDEDDVPRRWKEKPVEHFVDRAYFDGQGITPWSDDLGRSKLEGEAGDAEVSFLDSMSGAKDQSSTYVDLVMNPPGFTDYRGRNIWGLIYKDNCIRSKQEVFNLEDDKHVPECSEEDLYERMISGLQSTIMILSSEYNAEYSGWVPLLTVPNRGLAGPRRYRYNLDLYRWRVNVNPRWVDNVYLDFSVLLRTLARLHPIIRDCGCYTDTDADDEVTRTILRDLVDYAVTQSASGQPRYSKMPIFERKQDVAIRQMHNISRIFDCIDCEKCRLHGKVKLTALQIAVKTLGPTNYQRVISLERNEVTALINSLAYFTEAIGIISRMQRRTLALRKIFGTLFIWTTFALVRFALRSKTWLKVQTISHQTTNEKKIKKKAK